MSVHDNDAGYSTIFYRMELIGTQRAIVANSDEVYLRYVYQATDPNLMAADFRRALALALGRDLAVKLASSNTLESQLGKKADRALARARSSDALGAFPELRPRGSWATSRSGRHHQFSSD